MRLHSALGLSILLAMSLHLPAAAGDAPEGGSPAASPETTPLAEAVRHVPPGANAVLFTDWAAIKAKTGYEGVTSSTPIDTRIDAMLDMTEAFQPLAAYGISHFPTHAELWGWDNSDLDWEASVVVDGPPVAVLRFRDGFDLGPVRFAYEERGFAAEPYGDTTILSHEMDPDAEWLLGSDFGVLNTAFLDDGATLVLSSGLDGIKHTLDALSGAASGETQAQLIAEALGSPLTAGIDLQADGCTAYDPRWLPGAEDGPNLELLEAVGTPQPWAALGMGIDSLEQGRFALGYTTPQVAAADLESRVTLAEQGVSLTRDEPYAVSTFRVLDAAVEGSTIRLDVEPVDGRPDRLSQAFMTRDLVFAACG